jgi:hypothetical protein
MNPDVDIDNVLQGDEFDMDLELFEMRKQYNEMKRDRVSSQKNVDIMENKIKLLESEEVNVKKTLNRQVLTKNQMIKKMAELGAAKEDLIKAKMEQQKEAKIKSEKLQMMRENIQHTLKNYHKEVAEKNREEALKQKMIKEEILEIKKEQQNEILEKNKMTQKIVKDQIKGFAEKKKQEEIKKKIKMKEELARKMKEEEKLREELEQKMTQCEIKEGELIEKISQTKQTIISAKQI